METHACFLAEICKGGILWSRQALKGLGYGEELGLALHSSSLWPLWDARNYTRCYRSHEKETEAGSRVGAILPRWPPTTWWDILPREGVGGHVLLVAGTGGLAALQWWTGQDKAKCIPRGPRAPPAWRPPWSGHGQGQLRQREPGQSRFTTLDR